MNQAQHVAILSLYSFGFQHFPGATCHFIHFKILPYILILFIVRIILVEDTGMSLFGFGHFLYLVDLPYLLELKQGHRFLRMFKTGA